MTGLVLLYLLWIACVVLVVLGACWWVDAPMPFRDLPADDWMDIADVISDDHHPDGCDCDGIPLEGFTDEDAGVLRRNWLPLTDDERDELNGAFKSITNHYEGV